MMLPAYDASFISLIKRHPDHKDVERWISMMSPDGQKFAKKKFNIRTTKKSITGEVSFYDWHEGNAWMIKIDNYWDKNPIGPDSLSRELLPEFNGKRVKITVEAIDD